MAEIEIGAAELEEYPQIAAMDLSFESDYVWKTQTLEEYESFESSFQRIRLPKTIRVSFQAYSSANLETLIRGYDHHAKAGPCTGGISCIIHHSRTSADGS